MGFSVTETMVPIVENIAITPRIMKTDLLECFSPKRKVLKIERTMDRMLTPRKKNPLAVVSFTLLETSLENARDITYQGIQKKPNNPYDMLVNQIFFVDKL